MANEINSGTLSAALTQSFISDAWDMIYSNRTGLLAVAGMGGEAAAGVTEGSKYNWLNTRVDATSSPTTASALIGATTIAVTDGSKFRAGMMISGSDSEEVMLVTAVSSNDLTVVRGIGGTTATAITSGAVITIDSVGREENSLAANDGIYQPVAAFNYFQTMDTAIEMSRRSLATLQHGDTNDLDFQLQNRLRQLATQMDRALVRGRRVSETVGGNAITYAGGLRYFLDQAGAIKTDAAAAALTLDMINNLNAEIVARGGMADTIAVGINKARELNTLVSANYSSQRLADWSNDAGALNRLPSDLPLVGNVTNIVIDTNLADDELIIVDSNMISVKHMPAGNADATGAWRTLDATQNGQDGERVRVIGDFTMEIRQHETHMARLTNLG
jgi:hypothetical protein